MSGFALLVSVCVSLPVSVALFSSSLWQMRCLAATKYVQGKASASLSKKRVDGRETNKTVPNTKEREKKKAPEKKISKSEVEKEEKIRGKKHVRKQIPDTPVRLSSAASSFLVTQYHHVDMDQTNITAHLHVLSP